MRSTNLKFDPYVSFIFSYYPEKYGIISKTKFLGTIPVDQYRCNSPWLRFPSLLKYLDINEAMGCQGMLTEGKGPVQLTSSLR
jgi:hypothetical protein